MKKTLVLFRHGEAESDSNLGDHGRKLTVRGEDQATKTSKALASLNLGTCFFLVSDAMRARQTFASCKPFFKDVGSIEDPRLYLTGIEKMRVVLKNIDLSDDIETLGFVGHNPGLSLALASLAGDVTGLSTADAAVLSIDADNWNEALAMDGCWDVSVIIKG
jgi:phosphohistidine phosphatase